MLSSYLKIALKVMNRRPFFTFVSLFAISFTLVVLTIAAAVLDHLFGPLAPETRQDRTVGLYYQEMSGDDWIWDGSPGYALLDQHVRTLPDVERVTLFTVHSLVASYQTGEKTELFLKRTDGQFWRVFDFELIEGRVLTEDDEASSAPVAVINGSTRKRLFGDGPAISQALEIDGQRFQVVGVVADVSSLRTNPFSDVWVPISTAQNSNYREGLFGDFQALVVARDRADLPRIQDEFQSRLASVQLPDPEHYDTLKASLDSWFERMAKGFFAETGFESFGELYEPNDGALSARFWAAVLLIGFLFMLLPSVNLINVNVSRIMERASEIGVRKAFGASSRTLVAQFVVENLVLTLIGGALGLLISLGALELLSRTDLVPYADFEINLRVFGYGMLTALFFGLLSGVYPAWRMSRLDPIEALRGRSL
jgi:putative ABC transport system permease protein